MLRYFNSDYCSSCSFPYYQQLKSAPIFLNKCNKQLLHDISMHTEKCKHLGVASSPSYSQLSINLKNIISSTFKKIQSKASCNLLHTYGESCTNVQSAGSLSDDVLRFLNRMLYSIIPASAPNAIIPKNENAYNNRVNVTVFNMLILSQLILANHFSYVQLPNNIY